MATFFDKFKVRYKAGQYIFKDGEIGTEMYVIQAGRVEITRILDGSEFVIATLEKGDFFGEMAVLENLPRNGNAKALDDCELIVLTGSTFDKMIKSNIEIAARMLRGFSARLREANADIERLMVEKGVQLGGPPKTELHPQLRKQEAPPPVAPPPAARAPAHKERAERKKPAVKAPAAEPPAAPRAPAVPETILRDRPALVVRGTGKAYPITQAEITIGREDPVTGLKPTIDLTEEDINRFISRRHARIMFKDEKFLLVEEVGVTNGTYLNGRRLQAGVFSPIKYGDELCFGKVFLTFEKQG
jgi:CRP-like cAMP-binding protein